MLNFTLQSTPISFKSTRRALLIIAPIKSSTLREI